eukprot:scaffold1417_cov113-Cylindrotheca_fusiformis.AAC.5
MENPRIPSFIGNLTNDVAIWTFTLMHFVLLILCSSYCAAEQRQVRRLKHSYPVKDNEGSLAPRLGRTF